MISERNDPGQCSYPKIRDWFYAKADKLICQTYDAEKYFEHIGKSKLCVIPNPINPQLPQPYQGIRRKVVVAAGRLTNQKNHKLLISAFEQFHKKHQEYIKQKQELINSLMTEKNKLLNKTSVYEEVVEEDKKSYRR